jgi:hypothetical protein
VADVEVKNDGVFIKLRKELISSASSSKSDDSCVSSIATELARVKEVSFCEEDTVLGSGTFDCSSLRAGEFVSLESVDNIPMEELLASGCGERSPEVSEDICNVSLDTVLDANISC